MPVREKIILALDFSDPDHALKIVDTFSEHINTFKVGLELFLSGGPDIIRKIRQRGKRVFLDLKFHDIPNTVIKAALQATRLGVYMFNLHTSGGFEMMKRCKDAVVDLSLRENLERPRIIGVTVLTSLTNETIKNELCIHHSLRTHVKHLSKLAKDAGLDGVVASGQEVRMIREHYGEGFLIITPGIRASWNPPDDQRRTMTPREAIREGADFIVLGRAVLGHPEPVKALDLIMTEILTA
jgi:orotidine-5'-phosphate decarboxylase